MLALEGRTDGVRLDVLWPGSTLGPGMRHMGARPGKGPPEDGGEWAGIRRFGRIPAEARESGRRPVFYGERRG